MLGPTVDAAPSQNCSVVVKRQLRPNQAIVELAGFDLQGLNVSGQRFGIRVDVTLRSEHHLEGADVLTVRWVPDKNDQVGSNGDRHRRWGRCRELDSGQVDSG